jgi:hypothetical protein
MVTVFNYADVDLSLYKMIPLEGLNNYFISKNGIIYNKNTKRYNIPKSSKKHGGFSIELKNNDKRVQYLIKYLLYITYINNNSNIKHKDIIIKQTHDELHYINFRIGDLELKNPHLYSNNNSNENTNNNSNENTNNNSNENTNNNSNENTNNNSNENTNNNLNENTNNNLNENTNNNSNENTNNNLNENTNNNLNENTNNNLNENTNNNLNEDEEYNLNLFKKIASPELEEYLISKTGLIYNTKTKGFKKPYYHININSYVVHLHNKQYQLKHLLYITFIDSTHNIDELRNVKSKFMLNIKQTHDNLPYINFKLEDLELISKSDKLKLQARNNRIINKYDDNKKFIQSYNNIEDIRSEFNTKYNKYITLACSKNKNKLYNGYYFRYDDDDEIKNPELVINSESIGANQTIDYLTEEWKQLSGEYYDNYEISNFGRFRNINTKKILKPHESGNYLYANINIYNKELNKKEVKKIRMNVLVAQYFIPIPDNLQNVPNIVVDHIDGNKSNNHYTNLQYLTLGENNCKG